MLSARRLALFGIFFPGLVVQPARLETDTRAASREQLRNVLSDRYAALLGGRRRKAASSAPYGYTGCSPKKCKGIDRTKMQVTVLKSVLAEAETGDIVLISGTERSSTLIRMHTGSFYSHIAMVVKGTDIPETIWQKYGALRNGKAVRRDAGVYLFDADYEPDGSIDGPVIRPLKTHLQGQVSEFGSCVNTVFRKLQISSQRRLKLVETFVDVAYRVAGKRYTAQKAVDPRFFKLWASTVGIPTTSNGKRYFCSELVATAYKDAGLLAADTKSSSNWMPQDFASPNPSHIKHQKDINTLLQEGAQLGIEQRINLLRIGGSETC